MTDSRFLALLNSTCTIQRKVDSGLVDADGQTIFTWTTLASGVACRLEGRASLNRVKSIERGIPERTVVEEDLMYFPPLTDITEEDRVTALVRTADSETLYDVPLSVLLVTRVDDDSEEHHVEANVDVSK